METTASLMVEFTADTRDFDKGVKRVDKSLGGLVKDAGKGLKSLGSDISGLGRNLIGMTAPLAAGFGLAVKSALDFDTAMTNVGAVLGRSKEDMAGLSAEILAIGGNSVQGPQAVAEAFYDIVGGVSDASMHIPILNQAIALSTAGAADLGASTAALVATMNSYGFEADRASFVSDVFTQTVNKGVGTMDEFAAAFPSVTGLASSMGIELDKLGTYMAYMTTKGATASEASTMLRGAMTQLLNPSKDLQTAISALGYDTGEAMVKAEGLDGALALLKDYNGGTFAGLLTDQEALRAGLILTDDGLKEFAVGFGETLDGVTARTEALQLESASNQFAKLTSKIGEMGIKVGEALLPVLIELADAIMPIVTSIVDWIGKNPELVQGIASLTLGVGALGLALIPIGWLVGAAGTVFGILSTLVGGLTVVFGGLAVAVNAALWPISAVVLGVMAGIAIFTVFRDEITRVAGIVTSFMSEIGVAIGIVINDVRQSLETFIQLFEPVILAIGAALLELSNSPVFTAIRTAFEGAFNAVKGIVEGVVNAITGFLVGIGNEINRVLGQLGLLRTDLSSAQQQFAQLGEVGGAMLAGQVGNWAQTFNGQSANPNRPTVTQPISPIIQPQIRLPGKAMGGSARGWTMVGEDGPEIVKFGNPATVFSNPSTRGGNNYGGAMTGGGGAVNIQNLYVQGVHNINDLLDELETLKGRRSSQ